MMLQHIIEQLYDTSPEKIDIDAALDAISDLKEMLNHGEVRAAECHDGRWRVNAWVKKGILLAFRLGRLREYTSDLGGQFFDKDTMALKKLSISDNVRVVAGGSAIRDGAFVGEGVVIMPPAYVNIGAYIDRGTLIDSHALVGSCV